MFFRLFLCCIVVVAVDYVYGNRFFTTFVHCEYSVDDVAFQERQIVLQMYCLQWEIFDIIETLRIYIKKIMHFLLSFIITTHIFTVRDLLSYILYNMNLANIFSVQSN